MPKKNAPASSHTGSQAPAPGDNLCPLIDEVWTPRDRRAALSKLVERASLGNLEALKLLLAYRYGKPLERVEMTGDPPPQETPIDLSQLTNEEIAVLERAIHRITQSRRGQSGEGTP